MGPETSWNLNGGIDKLNETLSINVLSGDGFSSYTSLIVEVEEKFSLSSFGNSIVVVFFGKP